MEKKPLYHFRPGSPVFSIATAGCNLHCLNCQNWQLSQRGGHEMETIYRADPPDLVRTAKEEGCQSIAYTYSDPIVFYEYVYDSSELAHREGLTNVFITAGYINEKPLRRLCSVLDASNVDLKAFDDDFYRRITGATLRPVLDTLVTMREEGIWLEVTNLLIPTLNDDLALIRRMVRWIRDELGPDTPLHFSRFHPQYRMRNLPPTPGEALDRARREALDAGLRYVYVGNIPGHEGGSTYCPTDGTLLVARSGFWITENKLTAEGRCPVCNETIPGVWK
jgi:pyruvate formate lyase activating enzyme